MSEISTKHQPPKLQKDAVARNMLNEYAYPRKACSIVESHRTRKNALVSGRCNPPLQNSTNHSSCEDVTRPVLHPRPRQIYGDVFAPVYEPSLQDEINQSQKNKSKRIRLFKANKCEVCAANTGKSCIRVNPSATGPALAKEVLVMRAIRPKPTQRRVRAALSTPRCSPGPSPLSKSFTEDNFDDESDNVDGPIDDDSASIRSTASDEGFSTRLRFRVLITKNGAFKHLGEVGIFSPNMSCLDLSRVPSETDKVVLSYVEGPFEPGWDQDGRALRAAEVSLNSDAFPQSTETSQAIEGQGEATQRVSISGGKSISFAALPTIEGPYRQGHSPSREPAARFGRKTSTKFRRLCSIGSTLFKRKSVLDVASMAKAKLNEL